METQRLTFRRWTEDDASECYRYASDPALGYPAGWPTHITIEDSLRVIRENFARPETYAVVLKATGLPIGCIGFMLGESSTLAKQEGECEQEYEDRVYTEALDYVNDAIVSIEESGEYNFQSYCGTPDVEWYDEARDWAVKDVLGWITGE